MKMQAVNYSATITIQIKSRLLSDLLSLSDVTFISVRSPPSCAVTFARNDKRGLCLSQQTHRFYVHIFYTLHHHAAHLIVMVIAVFPWGLPNFNSCTAYTPPDRLRQMTFLSFQHIQRGEDSEGQDQEEDQNGRTGAKGTILVHSPLLSLKA